MTDSIILHDNLGQREHRALSQRSGFALSCPTAIICQALLADFPRSRRATTAGNAHLRAVFAQVGTHLGRSLANLCGVIDPARIIFSGLNMRSSHYWLEPAKTALFANVRAPMQGRLEFVANDRDDVFWSRGAAALIPH